MKTYRIWKWMLVTGKEKGLDKVDRLAKGTHFLTAYGDKRGGKRGKYIALTVETECKQTATIGGSHVSD